MGWASGSELAEDVWKVVRKLIEDKRARMKAARQIIELFEDHDCDTIDEAEQLCRDAGRVYDKEQDWFGYKPKEV